jgi:hypothetical protein
MMELTAKEKALILRKRHQEKVKAHAPPKVAKRAFPKADRGRERDPGYLAYLRRLPCVACMAEGGVIWCGPTEAAHLRFSDASQGRINPGLSVKPSDRFATPLGSGHHRSDQHMRREKDFWDRLGIEPGALAADLYAAYLAGADGRPVLQRHAQRRAA